MAAAEWIVVCARSTPRDMWAPVEWEGKPRLGPYLLEDGRHVMDVIADGEVDQLPFRVWCKQFNKGRRLGDLVWTTGIVKLASERFVSVLRDIDAKGWRPFDLELLDRTGERVPGYVGFATTGEGEDLDVSHRPSGQNFTFQIRPYVLEALRAAGADEFETWDPEE